MNCFGASAAILALALSPSPAHSRWPQFSPAEESCGGQVFKAGEVTRKARITRKPAPGFTEEARANDVSGVVRLTAVLCRTGRVTDIRVEQGLPHGLTEKAVAAARSIRFRPASKGGRSVSQAVILEYSFNVSGGEGPGESAKYERRLVEEIIIEGNRRLTDAQLLAHLRTRPGDVFDQAAVRRDLLALLELGTLDTTETRVMLEVGLRGGVVVIFNVVELPVIRSIGFKGLRSITEAEALAALRGKSVRREGVYNPAHIEAARRALLGLLAARGYRQAAVEAVIENVSSVSVVLTFVVKEGPHCGKADAPGRWF